MYEVKVYVINAGMTFPVTIAAFEYNVAADGSFVKMQVARSRAINFAKLIDKGFAVDVVNVADENDSSANFGLVFHRDAEF